VNKPTSGAISRPAGAGKKGRRGEHHEYHFPVHTTRSCLVRVAGILRYARPVHQRSRQLRGCGLPIRSVRTSPQYRPPYRGRSPGRPGHLRPNPPGAIRQGLFECFRDEQGSRAEVCVNHCDEDICTSWFLLTHADLTAPGKSAPLERFVNLVDVLDTTAGAYPLPPDLSPLKELAWVFSPYHCFRRSRELDRQPPEGHRGVVDEVLSRIERHLSGRGGSYPLDGRYERRGGGPGWVLIREVGAQARLAATADGIRAYVAVRERPDGRWAYVVGRASPFVSFDVPAILHALNEAEGTTKDRWGGSNLVGGSPRVQGSRLSPSEVERIINGFVGRTHARTRPRSPSIRDGRGRADSLAMPGAVASL